jgi:Tfp pilus assembly protein PilX
MAILAGKIAGNSRGAVLIIGIVLLAVMLALGSLMIKSISTEVTIAGNYETNTKSLFVAEGGLESVKSELSTNVSNAFTADGSGSGTTQQYMIGDASYPQTTVTNPVNWVGTSGGWYVVKVASATSLLDTSASTLLTNLNASWPIYKLVQIGTDYALVTLQRPTWFYSNATKVRFSVVSETDNLANTKLLNRKVASTYEIEMSNNFLTFQTFVSPSDNQTYADNKSADYVVIGSAGTHYGGAGAGYDYGILAGGGNAITGIWTYTDSDKTVVIQSCTSGTSTSLSGCSDYGVPETNTTNRTFILGGSGHGCLFGGVASGATITVSSSNRYKLKYASSVTCP